MSFSKPSRERLRKELAAAVADMDVQLVHTILADHHGDATDVDAVIGTGPGSDAIRDLLIESYKAWAAEMSGDDVATEVPGVLMALEQPDLWSGASV